MNKLLTSILIWILPLSLMAQTENKSPHYLFPSFEKGFVLMIGGKKYETSMNYNTVTEEMIYNQTGKMLALDRIELVDTVYIQGKKFVPADKKFYELIVKAPISLFIEYKKNINPGGKPSGYGGTSQTASVDSYSSLMNSGGIYELKLPEDYIITDASLNWIKKDNQWYSFISERQLLKIFPEKSDDIKKFIKTNDINIKKIEQLKALMKYINEKNEF